MRFFNIFLCIVGLTCPFTEGENDHYNLETQEKGVTIDEDVEIDEEQNVEIFRVPAHNNVPASNFYNDFKMGVTVIKILSKKACYISKMDPSLPSPQKLKQDVKLTKSQRGSLPITKRQNLLTPMGPAHRPSLTKGVLAFCGVFPIYKAGVSPMNTSNTGEEIIWHQPRTGVRQIRHVIKPRIMRNFTMCNHQRILAAVAECMAADWDLSCRVNSGSFYFYISCNHAKVRIHWECEEFHITFATPACCNFICPLPNGSD
ncbi:uncharacterized protein [Montipora foliosa]|uniref:uncharacterized protein n=1 Tax=Montipora foliosa TaxID=591990 RepID=UPI0035F194DC